MSTGLDRYIGGSAITPNARQMEWLALVEPSVQPSDALNDRWKKYLKARGYDSMRDWARAVSGNKSIALQDNLAALPFAGGYTETSSLSLDFAGSDYRVLDGGALTSKGFADIVTFTRSTTGTYFDNTGVMQTAATDAPRFDYDPVTLQPRGLLIEEARTNLLLRSEEFDNASWQRLEATIYANPSVAPTVGTTADKIIESANFNIHRVIAANTSITSGTTYTASIFVKSAGNSRLLELRNYNGVTDVITVFNPDTGLVLSGPGTAVSVGGGWYRLSQTFTAASTVTSNFVFQCYLNNGAATYLGDGTSGLYIWGAQLEAGSFPTSYIPTGASQVTRAADVASVNTLSPWYNASEGTLFIQGTKNNPANSPVQVGIHLTGTPANVNTDRIVVYEHDASFGVTVGSTQQAIITLTPQQSFKHAGSYTAGDFAAAYNGTSNSSAGIGGSSIPTVTTMWIGHRNSLNQLNGHIRAIRYFPRKLANSELQAITV